MREQIAEALLPQELLEQYAEAVEKAESVGAFKLLTKAERRLSEWLWQNRASLPARVEAALIAAGAEGHRIGLRGGEGAPSGACIEAALPALRTLPPEEAK